MNDEGSVEFYDDEDDEDTLLIEYKNYKDIPPVYTKIYTNLFYDYLTKQKPYDKLIEEFIIPQSKRLIAGYKQSKEYKESKYYKIDIIKQKLKDIDKDFV